MKAIGANKNIINSLVVDQLIQLIQFLGIPQPLQSEFHRYARLNLIDVESYEALCQLSRLNISVSV